MKTAISIPDATFHRADRKAAALGMTRSEFFARAAARYLDELEEDAVTEQVNAAIDSLEEPDCSTRDATAVGRRRLADNDAW